MLQEAELGRNIIVSLRAGPSKEPEQKARYIAILEETDESHLGQISRQKIEQIHSHPSVDD